MKLNLGCGYNKREGYVNIDCREEVEPDVCVYIEDLNYATNSIDEIYLSHILEHIKIEKARELLKEFYRWLKKGGELLVGVPNLTILGKLVGEGEEDEILFKWIFGSGDGGVKGHKWGFTENTLKEEIEKAEFKVVGYFPPQDDDSGFEYKGQFLSLNLRCVK